MDGRVGHRCSLILTEHHAVVAQMGKLEAVRLGVPWAGGGGLDG